MTLTLNLNSNQEARLKQLALSAKISPEQLAQSVVENLLATEATSITATIPTRNIRSFRGAGAKSPMNQDPQAYVYELRQDWDDDDDNP